MRRRDDNHTPAASGWVSIQDKHSFVLGVIDCSEGGAQECFDQLCQDFERAGWTLEDTAYDSRFIHRRSVRWCVSIYPDDPREDDDARVLVPVLPR